MQLGSMLILAFYLRKWDDIVVVNQEWHQTKEKLMARWGLGNQLPCSSKLKLHIQVSGQGSDWNLHILSINFTA